MAAGLYTPRRASKRWLDGAPPQVVDCLDNKGQSADRYTVIMLSGEPRTTFAKTWVFYLAMSSNPFHPQGVGQTGELSAYEQAAYRYREKHRRVRWQDLPPLVRQCVEEFLNEDVAA